MLAVVEIPFAVALFWWITTISPWPWFTVVGLMAAPMLLLRSPASIDEGVAQLRMYWEGRKRARSWTELCFVGVLAAIVSAVLSYAWAQQWLPGVSAWPLFFVSMLIGALASAVAFAVVVAFAFASMEVDGVLGGVAGAVAGAIAGAIAGAGAVAGVGVVAGLGVVVVVSAPVSDKLGPIIILPSVVFGFFLRMTLIRVVATWLHMSAGLGAFAKNWRETVLVIDIWHPPAMLPGAGEVSKVLTFSGAWGMPLAGSSAFDTAANGVGKLFLMLFIYLPALFYRWNIKASSWLWGPVALMLWPVAWVNDEAMRRKTAFWTTWGLQSLIGSGVAALFACLAMRFVPADLVTDFPHWLQTVQTRGLAPGPGLRYGLLWLVAVSMAALLLAAYRMRAAHAKALEGAGDFHKGYDVELKEEFRRLAQPVRRLLQWNLAVIALTLWIFALWWSLNRWPNELNGAVWAWITPYL